MRSGAPVLLATGRISESELQAMLSEMDALLENPEAIFYYRFVQAEAVR
ncbi:hypothetical protein [Nitritalea halalkaliphila]|nr:hypothetical protein [Nitritalea halalkaliphila]